MTERYIAGHGSHKTMDGVEHHWYLNAGWQPCPEPAAPPTAPTDEPDVVVTSGNVAPERPTDDVAPSYFDTLRGSVTDPDVLAAAAKAEADRPAPTDDVAALVARLRGTVPLESMLVLDAAADALERLAADLAAARAEAERWKADALRMERELELSGEDRVAAEDEADALRRQVAALTEHNRALISERGVALRQVAAVRALCHEWETYPYQNRRQVIDALRAALDTEEPT